eukprot:s80_g27.t1
MVDGLPTPPALGGLGRDGDDTEIDQDDIQDPSHLAGLDIPVEETPGTLRRKLQFDPVECGLDPEGQDFNQQIDDLFGEENNPNYKNKESMDDIPIDEIFGEESDPENKDTDLFGLPQTETGASIVVPDGDVPNDLPPSDAVPEGEVLEKQLEAEIDKSSQPTKVFKSSEKARENSRKWHQKWISKGVPKDGNNQKKKTKVATKAKGPTSSGGGSSSSSQPAKSLAQAKDMFISKWIEGCGMDPSNDRRNAAIKAWMNSSERSDYIAGWNWNTGATAVDQRQADIFERFLQKQQVGGRRRQPVTYGLHLVRAHLRCARNTGRSAAVFFVDLTEAFYRIFRPLCMDNGITDEALAAFLHKLQMPHSALQELWTLLEDISLM